MQPPNERGRDIPPGIARMLQQIRVPHARPQPLPPQRETRPSASGTSRAAVLPTGPPMGLDNICTPSPRVLSRPSLLKSGCFVHGLCALTTLRNRCWNSEHWLLCVFWLVWLGVLHLVVLRVCIRADLAL